jgi:hypothetical protein
VADGRPDNKMMVAPGPEACPWRRAVGGDSLRFPLQPGAWREGNLGSLTAGGLSYLVWSRTLNTTLPQLPGFPPFVLPSCSFFCFPVSFCLPVALCSLRSKGRQRVTRKRKTGGTPTTVGDDGARSLKGKSALAVGIRSHGRPFDWIVRPKWHHSRPFGWDFLPTNSRCCRCPGSFQARGTSYA